MDKLNLQNSLSSLKSPQDLKALLMEVRRYARWFADAGIKARVAGVKKVEPLALSETAAALIKEAAGKEPLNGKILEDLIAQLTELEETMPRIVVTLAAVPGNKLKGLIVEWCRKNIDPGLLVDFRFNATILGGMVVQYGSHVYDWSWRRQILANRATFPEVLRRV